MDINKKFEMAEGTKVWANNPPWERTALSQGPAGSASILNSRYHYGNNKVNFNQASKHTHTRARDKINRVLKAILKIN